MTASPVRNPSIVERLLAALMLALLRASFACLAAGLVLWLANRQAPAAHVLTAGLLALLAIPLFKVVAVMVSAARERDWLTCGATLAVLVILVALTIRDAARLG